MASFPTIRIIAGLFVTLCFAVLPFPSFSLQQTKHRRTTKKTHDRFVDWASSNRNQSNDSLFLWIDGNNVRGIGKFEWNAVELQHRVVRFCHKYQVPNAIVVWDHGSHQLACSKQYYFDESGNETTRSLLNDDDIFCVNLVTLFSGIRQRADDVLVKESNHLIASSLQTDGKIIDMNTKMDWSSIAFVTNDSELNYKLRRQATPNSPSIRLSRRKRRDIGKIHDCDDIKHDTNETPNDEAIIGDGTKKKNPLFCDSTGFVDLLCEMPRDYDDDDVVTKMNCIDQEASDLINKAKDSLRRCSKAQRRGYNPRREKTWERCVQAETFRRFLLKQARTAEGEAAGLPLQADTNAVFVANYLKELHTTRGYFGPLQNERGTDDKNSNEDDPLGPFFPFLGPSRLDKQQRRLLDRYNALVKKGDTP